MFPEPFEILIEFILILGLLSYKKPFSTINEPQLEGIDPFNVNVAQFCMGLLVITCGTQQFVALTCNV